jgi:hypothetical protein
MPYANTPDQIAAALDEATGHASATDNVAAVQEPEPKGENLGPTTREPAPTEPILQFFGYQHLPAAMQEVSKPFGDLANFILDALPRNAERSVALRKLLEAKDAAVRASFAK